MTQWTVQKMHNGRLTIRTLLYCNFFLNIFLFFMLHFFWKIVRNGVENKIRTIIKSSPIKNEPISITPAWSCERKAQLNHKANKWVIFSSPPPSRLDWLVGSGALYFTLFYSSSCIVNVEKKSMTFISPEGIRKDVIAAARGVVVGLFFFFFFFSLVEHVMNAHGATKDGICALWPWFITLCIAATKHCINKAAMKLRTGVLIFSRTMT